MYIGYYTHIDISYYRWKFIENFEISYIDSKNEHIFYIYYTIDLRKINYFMD